MMKFIVCHQQSLERNQNYKPYIQAIKNIKISTIVIDFEKMRKVPNIFVNPKNSSITLSMKQKQCSLIWLHGLGDKAEGFMSFFSHSHSPLYTGVKIKMIQAPQRKVTLNNGATMNSWYDIRSLKRFTEQQDKVFNFEHINQTMSVIDEHVKEQVQFWKKQEPQSQINPLHRVFVGGFSQGGVMSLHYGMQATDIPAGVISLSAYMLRSTPLNNYKKLPVYIMHGQEDQVINQIQAKRSYERILGESAIVQYNKIKGLGHSVRLQQLGLMKNWFKDVNQMIGVHYGGKGSGNAQKAN